MPLDDWTAFARATGLKAGLLKKLRPFITEKDESARPVEGEADAELRDTERVPFRYGGGIPAFFEKEVLPFVPDAWIDESKPKIGYEIPFTRYFFKFTTLRDSSVIMEDIRALEERIQASLAEVFAE